MDVNSVAPDKTLLQAAACRAHLQRVCTTEFPIALSPSSKQKELSDFSQTLLERLPIQQEADLEGRVEIRNGREEVAGNEEPLYSAMSFFGKNLRMGSQASLKISANWQTVAFWKGDGVCTPSYGLYKVSWQPLSQVFLGSYDVQGVMLPCKKKMNWGHMSEKCLTLMTVLFLQENICLFSRLFCRSKRRMCRWQKEVRGLSWFGLSRPPGDLKRMAGWLPPLDRPFACSLPKECQSRSGLGEHRKHLGGVT